MKNNTFQKNNSFPNNQLLQNDNQLVRVLDSTTDKVFIIDCIKKTMPVWTDAESLKDYLPCSEDALQEITDTILIDLDNLDSEGRRTAYERYTMIAPLLPFVSDQKKREWTSRRVFIRNYLVCMMIFHKEKKQQKLDGLPLIILSRFQRPIIAFMNGQRR